ncbi:MAG: hypothetical protein JHC81_01645 [Brevundimonas sp.]|uniref:hypothetical protein n=1 Tax=Brevundimonas sp. TaxID=1871086 RepID=UPI001A32B16E|nr:hypothetical protein [Brevundimonas sp.]MBJ7446210.1 hypothetical protein [Brevundimonas sp.]
MNVETIKANVKSLTAAEWVMVAIVVIVFAAVLETTGFIMGFPVAYILVLAMRRHAAQTAQRSDHMRQMDR